MASDKIKTLTDSNFEEETKNGVVLVDFWAEWCGPCRRIAPIVEQLATDYEGRATIGKMNVDENPNIPTSRFQVRGIPTLVTLPSRVSVPNRCACSLMAIIRSGPMIPSLNPGQFSTIVVSISWPPASSPSIMSGFKLARAV